MRKPPKYKNDHNFCEIHANHFIFGQKLYINKKNNFWQFCLNPTSWRHFTTYDVIFPYCPLPPKYKMIITFVKYTQITLYLDKSFTSIRKTIPDIFLNPTPWRHFTTYDVIFPYFLLLWRHNGAGYSSNLKSRVQDGIPTSRGHCNWHTP